MVCPECDRACLEGNFQGNPGGPTHYHCTNCGLKISASRMEELAEEEKVVRPYADIPMTPRQKVLRNVGL